MTRPTDLKRLDELDDFTVAAGDPDPRGWNVESTDGRGIGRVADLVVDTTAMKARYLDVEIDKNLNPAAHDRHVFVPTEAVTIGKREREERRISLPVTAESAARAAGRPDVILAEPERYAGGWPVSDAGGCSVHLTRGGRNG